ncbi:MAG: hypothetical protein WC475_05050 [Candidatus Paceibacterota bacterium]
MEKQNLKELVSSVEGHVAGSTISVEAVYAERGIPMMGGTVRMSEAGQKYQTKLKMGINSSDEVEEIIFNGFCNIENGDSIRAYILRASEKIGYHEKTNIYDKGRHTIYERRPFNKTEVAFKIEKLNENGVAASYLDKRLHDAIYGK